MPMAIARSAASVKTLVSSDSVAGMMNAAPAPITARAVTSWPTPPANAAPAERDSEDGEAEQQRAPAPEAVAERAREQQQAGEHERVGVDDPLQLADVGVEVAHERRERDVDDRVVDHDHEQADAQHRRARASGAVPAATEVRHGPWSLRMPRSVREREHDGQRGRQRA